MAYRCHGDGSQGVRVSLGLVLHVAIATTTGPISRFTNQHPVSIRIKLTPLLTQIHVGTWSLPLEGPPTPSWVRCCSPPTPSLPEEQQDSIAA